MAKKYADLSPEAQKLVNDKITKLSPEAQTIVKGRLGIAETAPGAAPATNGAQWSDVPANALKDVKDMSLGLPVMVAYLSKKGIGMPEEIVRSAVKLATGTPIEQTEIGKDAQTLFAAQKELLNGFKNEALHPVESFKKHPVNTVMDAVGIALPMFKGAAKAGSAVAGGTGKRLISATLGPSLEAINTRLSRNPEIISAKPFDVLAREIPDDVQKLSDIISKQSGDALDTLSTSKFMMEGAKAKDAILNAVRSAREGLGRSVSDASVGAKKALDRYAYRLKRLGNTVSESELGQIVRDIDNDIDWDAADQKPLNGALENIRTKIDGMLKTNNPEYAAAMEPVAENMRLLKKSERLFNLKRDIGKGYRPGNNTAAALKGAIKETRVDSQDVLTKLKEVTGRDYLREAENASMAEAFTGGRAQGSRRVNLGAMVGAVLGGGAGHFTGSTPAGMIMGGLAGAYLDTQGGTIAGKLIDAYVKGRGAMPSMSPVAALIERAKGMRLPALIQNEANAIQAGPVMVPAFASNETDNNGRGWGGLPRGNLLAEELLKRSRGNSR
jgi:predicted phage tail protein